ncbi:hypothetical protein [Paenibacillus eucommiae]|uniref:DUF2157 domain-containing protein n=1 Tax=Paenibacillus eucommiae TaxID=1355755 RepID=A0ABS4JAL3_9BACL|nr:hypothetical protein [Paenibacillus eucommiae]MBP1996882.1 hypothetical protein [Paenibacillus eucommiae]
MAKGKDRSVSPAGRSGAKAEPEKQALQDIEFIKQLIAKNKKKLDQSPPFLFIWGTYMMVGYIGMQFNHTLWPMWFWSCGAVIGGLLSSIVGIRQSRNAPVQEGGSYGWMFWLPFMATMLVGCAMMFTDIVRLEYASLFWCMLIGIAYISLGTLVGKGPVFLGIWFIVLSIFIRLFMLEYQNLLLGLLGGGSVIVTALLLQRRKKHG